VSSAARAYSNRPFSYQQPGAATTSDEHGLRAARDCDWDAGGQCRTRFVGRIASLHVYIRANFRTNSEGVYN